MSSEESRRMTERFMLRLPDGMRDQIRAAADTNNRSMNAEIVARLQETFEASLDNAHYTPKWIVDQIVAELEKRLPDDDKDIRQEPADEEGGE